MIFKRWPHQAVSAGRNFTRSGSAVKPVLRRFQRSMPRSPAQLT